MSVNENINTNRYVFRETEDGTEALHCRSGVTGQVVTLDKLKPYLESLGVKTTHRRINAITTGTSNYTIYHKEGLLIHYKFMSMCEKVYLMVFVYELPYYNGILRFNKVPSGMMKAKVRYMNKIDSREINREFDASTSSQGDRIDMRILASILSNSYFAKQVQDIVSENRTEVFLRYNYIEGRNEIVLYNSKFKRHRVYSIEDLTLGPDMYSSSVFDDKIIHVTRKAIVDPEDFLIIKESISRIPHGKVSCAR